MNSASAVLKKNGVIIVVLCLLPLVSMGGNVEDQMDKLPPLKKKRYAKQLLEAGNFFKAIRAYQYLIEENPKDAKFAYKLAESYKGARNYPKAAKWYKTSHKYNAGKEPAAQYRQAMMLKMDGQYDKAIQIFNQFLESDQASSVEKLKKYAKMEKKAYQFVQEQRERSPHYKVNNMGKKINSFYSDFAPQVIDNNKLVYSSLNLDSTKNSAFLSDKFPLSHIYQSSIQDESWTESEPMKFPLNTSDENSGNAAFSPDGKRIYFTKCAAKTNVDIKCNIYMSKRKGSGWEDPVKLGSSVNKKNATNTHPAVAEGQNGKDLLYFVSNREGGQGRKDIWHSTVSKDGSTSKAENPGPAINTERDDVTPYYSSKDTALYFSSNGHIGMGGLDIYKVKGHKDSWDKAHNLGKPFNSSADDMHFAKGEHWRIDYLTSNREGTLTKKHATCCDDIWRVKNTVAPEFAVKGQIKEWGEDSVKQPLKGVNVSLYDITKGKEELVYQDSILGSDYLVDLEVGKKYEIKFEKPNYFFKKHEYSTIGREESDTFSNDVTLQKIQKDKSYKLSNIYYDFGDTTLRDRGKETLDKLYEIMTDNPDLVIELSAHTDSIGTKRNNLKISQGRANSCVNYLSKKGIDEKRLQAKGFGESKPIASNTNPDGTDNPEGRQKNRRTEFKIIGELDGADVIYEDSYTGKEEEE